MIHAQLFIGGSFSMQITIPLVFPPAVVVLSFDMPEYEAPESGGGLTVCLVVNGSLQTDIEVSVQSLPVTAQSKFHDYLKPLTTL